MPSDKAKQSQITLIMRRKDYKQTMEKPTI